ncbi:MAG: tetratricopeptide repeat protein [Chloroflexi bacterium]|nr:tetratricopeptide repeat protein [Chloroflexota bacterium]
MQEILQYEAVRLFVDRAVAARPDFTVTAGNLAAVIQICQRLDGIPLAIELAAARVRLLQVEQIAARLDDRFRLLTGGNRAALPRQQTLQAMIDWSHNLLTGPEQTLLRRLSVFAGGWTLEAAEAVSAASHIGQFDGFRRNTRIQGFPLSGGVSPHDILDLLAQLIDKSLVMVEELDGKIRYRFLETIRQYAHEKLLEAGEGDAVRNRHLEFFSKLAEEGERRLDGPEQVAWRQRLETDYDNLRAALQWAVQNNTEATLQLAGTMAYIWFRLGYYTEGRPWLEEILAQPWALGRTAARAKALQFLGNLQWAQGDLARSRAPLEESISIWRELAASSVPTAYNRGLASALCYLTLAEAVPSTYEQARVHGSESVTLWREIGDKYGLALSLRILANVPMNQGDYAEARQLLEESLALFRDAGDIRGQGIAMTGLSNLAEWQGDITAMRSWSGKALDMRHQTGDKWGEASLLSALGRTDLYEGNYERARGVLKKSLSLALELGNQPMVARALLSLGQAAVSLGDHERALAHITESLPALHDPRNPNALVFCVVVLAAAATLRGQPLQAVRLCGAADALFKTIHTPFIHYWRAENDRTASALRAQLEETVFAIAWAEGQAMSLDQAVAYALEDAPID